MMEDEEDETIQSTKQPNFLVPDEIEQVILLPSKLSKDLGLKSTMETTLSEFEYEDSKLPELKPLPFIVGKNFFDIEAWSNSSPYITDIENRGFLQFVNERKVKVWHDKVFTDEIEDNDQVKNDDYYVEKKKIELHFPVVEKIGERKFRKLAETYFHFFWIESVSISKGYLKRNLIIKFKPGLEPNKLFIDQIEREIILTIKRKDFELAEQVVAAILTQVNEIELRKIL